MIKFDKEFDQSLRILLVFAVISSIFELIQRFSPYIYYRKNIYQVKSFIEMRLIWFIAMSFIIAGLIFYIKKIDGKFSLDFIHNPMIRLASGLLILFDGIYSLSISLTVAFANIISFHQFTSENGPIGTPKETFLISSIFPSLINLLQILLGLYFILYKKRKKEIDHLDI